MSLSLSVRQVRLLRLNAQRLLPANNAQPDPPADILQQVCGLQAQELPSALLAVRARSNGLTAAAVERARQEERSIVWTWCMRGTLHLIAAQDALWLLPLLGPTFIAAGERRFRQLGWDEATAIRGLRLLRELLADHRGLTRPELIQHLEHNGLPHEGQAPFHLIYRTALEGMLCAGADQEDQTAYVLFESWLGKVQPMPRQTALAELARRYLQAYAPAGPEDMATWSGLKLSEVRQAWQHINAELVQVEMAGETNDSPPSLWLLKSQLARLDAVDRLDHLAPTVRLLPRYDSYLLAYTSRDLVVEPVYARRVHPGGGIIHPVLLVNGQARGTWKTRRRSTSLEVHIEPFKRLPGDLIAHIEAEVADLGRYLEQETYPIIASPA